VLLSVAGVVDSDMFVVPALPQIHTTSLLKLRAGVMSSSLLPAAVILLFA